MGMTMTQKILAAHAGLDSVEAGQLIERRTRILNQRRIPRRSASMQKNRG